MKQDKLFTMDEFSMKFGWECERCDFFDTENEKCLKGRHPRQYTLSDGPNEFCHAVKFCMLFRKWVDRETSSEDIRRAISKGFDCSYQQYC